MTEYSPEFNEMPEDAQGDVDPPIEPSPDFEKLNTLENTEYGPLTTGQEWQQAAVKMQKQKALLARVLRSQGLDPEESPEYVFLAGRLSMAKDQVFGYEFQDVINRFETGEGIEEVSEDPPEQ